MDEPWLQSSWSLCTLHTVPHPLGPPFAPSQEDLEQPAALQEDKAATGEEEVAEEVSAGLLEDTGQACFPPRVPRSLRTAPLTF